MESAADVLSFDNLRYVINAGPHCLGGMPSEEICSLQPGVERCRGNFTVLPAVVALNPGNVGVWLGRSDGYRLTGSFFFGVNTALRLGFTAGSNWTQLINPVTGLPAGEQGMLAPATGPWGKKWDS